MSTDIVYFDFSRWLLDLFILPKSSHDIEHCAVNFLTIMLEILSIDTANFICKFYIKKIICDHSIIIRFITRKTFLVFSGILIGCIILLPPEIVFL